MSRTLNAVLLGACLLQARAMREMIKKHEAPGNDVCSNIVKGSMLRRSFKRRTEKCKCPVDSFMMGDTAECQTLNRYFNPVGLEGLGCACTKCSDIVINSDLRNTAGEQEFEKCKCPEGAIVNGHDKACFSRDPSRYFDPRKLSGKDCQCWDSMQVTTTEVNEEAPLNYGRTAQPVLYQISTRPWLYQLAQRGVPANCGIYVCLKDVPFTEWEKIAKEHHDVIWLMGVWQLGKRSVTDAIDVMHWWENDLPDMTEDDVIGSPYSIVGYIVNPEIGTKEDLLVLKAKINSFGMKLMLDFIPNHSAKDSIWVKEHPEIYMYRPTGDVELEDKPFPCNVLDARKRTGGNCSNAQWWEKHDDKQLAYGRSPWPSDLWQDTYQINYWAPETREFMKNVLVELAEITDGLRCDMAMLPLNDVFEVTWGEQMNLSGFKRPTEEFWKFAIDAVREKNPDMIFIGEAYDYMLAPIDERELLVFLGFDYIYDKKILDNLEHPGEFHYPPDPHATLKKYITSHGRQFHQSMVHFVENHDEPRAALALGGASRAFVGAVVASTLPGMRLFYAGQYEGFKNRLIVQLRRAKAEPVDDQVYIMYNKLLNILADPVFHMGEWTYIDVPEDIPLLAWRWAYGDKKRLVVTNWKSDGSALMASTNIKVADAEANSSFEQVVFTDLLSGGTWSASERDIRSTGLPVSMFPNTAAIYSYDVASRE